jgi:P63C domain
MSNEPTGKAKGGFARAEVLAPKTRSDIARRAAEARWKPVSIETGAVPVVTHRGMINIADMQLPCFVLGDGRRVISGRGMTAAIGMKGRGQGAQRIGEHRAIKPFMSNELAVAIENPIMFLGGSPRGNAPSSGFEAIVLQELCEALLKARDAGALQTEQERRYAQFADMLIRAFARIGIVALVDEATGYQEVRDRHALQAILDAFLRHELAAWAKRFPDEFYEQIFRLRKWTWRGRGTNPPQVVAAYTKDIVYARLAPGIIEELEKRNPSESGRRKGKHHQLLTTDVGHPALAQHLHAVVTLMRVSTSWDQFKMFLDQAHPRRGDTLQLPLMIDVSYAPQQPNETLPLFEQSPDAPQQ